MRGGQYDFEVSAHETGRSKGFVGAATGAAGGGVIKRAALAGMAGEGELLRGGQYDFEVSDHETGRSKGFVGAATGAAGVGLMKRAAPAGGQNDLPDDSAAADPRLRTRTIACIIFILLCSNVLCGLEEKSHQGFED